MKSNLGWDHALHALTTIGDQGLETPAELTLFCQCMTPLASAIKQGKITAPGELKTLLNGVKKKVEDLQVSKAFGRLQYVAPVPFGKILVGNDFVADSKVFAKDGGKQILGQEACDFYKKQENWHLLPDDPRIVLIVFCDVLLGSGDDPHVPCLCRDGVAGWYEGNRLLKSGFRDGCVVAVA